MADIVAIKNYFRKLQKIIEKEADLSVFGIKLIKRNKIDDVLVCILAVLPDSYKKALKQKHMTAGTNSLSGYNSLFKAIKGKFALSSEHYLVRPAEAIKLIDVILKHIDRDVTRLEDDE